MPRKFRCGRLILTKDGKIESVVQKSGGGTRLCDWDNKDMRFNEAHDQLLIKFRLNGCEYKTSFYDFEMQPLNVEEYETVKEYIDKYGLNPLSTVMFLCTHEVDNSGEQDKVKKKNRAITEAIPSAVEQNTSITSIENEHIVKNEEDSDQEQVHESSSFEYSFKKSIDELMKDVNDFINKNSYDKILNRIFENICLIHAHIYLTIDQVNEKFRQSKNYIHSLNQREIDTCMNTLYSSCNLAKKTTSLLKQSQDKYDDILMFTMIFKSFKELFKNLKTLNTDWFKAAVSNNNYRISEDSPSSPTYPSLQSKPSDTRVRSSSPPTYSSFQSKPSDTRVRSSSLQDHHKIEIENFTEELQISSSIPDERLLISNSSEPVSLVQERFHKKEDKKSDFFQCVIDRLENLFYLSRADHLSSFHECISSLIDEIKSVQLRINIDDDQSIHEAKRGILSVKNQLIKIFSQSDTRSENYLIRQLKVMYDKTLHTIERLSTFLDRCQAKIYRNNQQEDSHPLSTPRSLSFKRRKFEDRPLIRSKRRRRTIPNEDDQH